MRAKDEHLKVQFANSRTINSVRYLITKERFEQTVFNGRLSSLITVKHQSPQICWTLTFHLIIENGSASQEVVEQPAFGDQKTQISNKKFDDTHPQRVCSKQVASKSTIQQREGVVARLIFRSRCTAPFNLMVLRISFNKSNAYQLQHTNQWHEYGRFQWQSWHQTNEFHFDVKRVFLIDPHIGRKTLHIVYKSFGFPFVERAQRRIYDRFDTHWPIYGIVILPCCRRIKWTLLLCSCLLEMLTINGITVFPKW